MVLLVVLAGCFNAPQEPEGDGPDGRLQPLGIEDGTVLSFGPSSVSALAIHLARPLDFRDEWEPTSAVDWFAFIRPGELVRLLTDGGPPCTNLDPSNLNGARIRPHTWSRNEQHPLDQGNWILLVSHTDDDGSSLLHFGDGDTPPVQLSWAEASLAIRTTVPQISQENESTTDVSGRHLANHQWRASGDLVTSAPTVFAGGLAMQSLGGAYLDHEASMVLSDEKGPCGEVAVKNLGQGPDTGSNQVSIAMWATISTTSAVRFDAEFHATAQVGGLSEARFMAQMISFPSDSLKEIASLDDEAPPA